MKHGFDITLFAPDAWQAFKLATGLTYKGRGKRSFEWISESGLTVVTQNNPDTGEYGPNTESDFQRENEVGFASYIGLEGPDVAVKDAARLIRDLADYVKGESPGRRDFI